MKWCVVARELLAGPLRQFGLWFIYFCQINILSQHIPIPSLFLLTSLLNKDEFLSNKGWIEHCLYQKNPNHFFSLYLLLKVMIELFLFSILMLFFQIPIYEIALSLLALSIIILIRYLQSLIFFQERDSISQAITTLIFSFPLCFLTSIGYEMEDSNVLLYLLLGGFFILYPICIMVSVPILRLYLFPFEQTKER